MNEFPFLDGVEAQSTDLVEALLAQNWRPTLSITGAGGMPPLEQAGNVLRTHTDLKVSVRIPPGVESEPASEMLKQLLENDPPHGAHVSMTLDAAANGFAAPSMPNAVDAALDAASQRFFDRGYMPFYEGGTIPFMAMMQASYPAARYLVTGAAGPGNNAHGPDEKLHIPTAKAVTKCVSAALVAMCD